MKVILLAGGFGTRLSEYTESIPKPMVTVGGRPIIWHIMRNYAHFGHKDFYLALGYKAEVIKEYFLHYRTMNANFTVDLGTGVVHPHQTEEIDWSVTLQRAKDFLLCDPFACFSPFQTLFAFLMINKNLVNSDVQKYV